MLAVAGAIHVAEVLFTDACDQVVPIEGTPIEGTPIEGIPIEGSLCLGNAFCPGVLDSDIVLLSNECMGNCVDYPLGESIVDPYTVRLDDETPNMAEWVEGP